MNRQDDALNSERRNTVTEFFSNTKRFGSLHDAYFHFFHKDYDLARECVSMWFPDVVDKFELDQLQVHSWEFFSKELKKSVVDLIYTVPFRDGSGTAPITLVLEHKAQSGGLEDAATLAQTLGYVVSFCQELIESCRAGTRKETRILQPIPIVLYTGANLKLRELNWEKLFYLPEDLAQFQFRIPVRFLNITSLCQSQKLKASPFLSTAYNLMSNAVLKRLEEIRATAFAPLRTVTDWRDREYNLLHASAFYYLKNAINYGVKVDQSTVDELFASAERGKDGMMKSIWDEINAEIAKNEHEKGREEGIGIGRKEGIGIGRKEGIGIGRLETLKENAANMRAEGLNDETIARYLRVDVADVRIWLDSEKE